MSELKPCPACGGVAEMKRQGNDYTKKRRIVVRCPACRLERADAAIHHSMEWLEGVATKNWNTRPIEDALRAEVERLKVAEGEAMLVVESQDASIAALKDERDECALGVMTASERAGRYANQIASLKAELAGYQEANHAVAVCRNHTNDIITRDGCVICDLARYTAPLTEEQARTIRDTIAPREDQTFSEWLKSCDAAIRAAREAK